MTAATFVGLMSLPGLAVLYGGVMQKRWSVNSMMLTFVAFCLVLVAWCLWAFKMGFGTPIGSGKGFLDTFWGKSGTVLSTGAEEGRAIIPSITEGPPFHFPMASLVYFQFVFAAITPILMLGSVLGRISFKAWIPFVLLWITFVYTINAFLIWGGGYFAAHGALDYSGGYVIHLAAGISGFVAAAVIGPRLQRDREIDAPNNLLMVAAGAGLLWLGWNGFNGGDSYYAGANASAAVINTNLCTAVAMLVWIAWDYIFRDKPSLIGSVNGMIAGMSAIRELGLDELLIERARSGTPLLGLCLGMQLLFERSEEHDGAEGLGLLAGTVRRLNAPGLKLPHIGWSEVHWLRATPLADGLPDPSYLYHVHSFAPHPADEETVLATADYGETFAAVVGQGNVYGTQSHPEKSSAHGLALLANFTRLCGRAAVPA
jgi:imidazole glycerol phosphate synthase glutamine amidotransferase subunit